MGRRITYIGISTISVVVETKQLGPRQPPPGAAGAFFISSLRGQAASESPRVLFL